MCVGEQIVVFENVRQLLSYNSCQKFAGSVEKSDGPKRFWD